MRRRGPGGGLAEQGALTPQLQPTLSSPGLHRPVHPAVQLVKSKGAEQSTLAVRGLTMIPEPSHGPPPVGGM